MASSCLLRGFYPANYRGWAGHQTGSFAGIEEFIPHMVALSFRRAINSPSRSPNLQHISENRINWETSSEKRVEDGFSNTAEAKRKQVGTHVSDKSLVGVRCMFMVMIAYYCWRKGRTRNREVMWRLHGIFVNPTGRLHDHWRVRGVGCLLKNRSKSSCFFFCRGSRQKLRGSRFEDRGAYVEGCSHGHQHVHDLDVFTCQRQI